MPIFVPTDLKCGGSAKPTILVPLIEKYDDISAKSHTLVVGVNQSHWILPGPVASIILPLSSAAVRIGAAMQR
jgi:hypothetical protein